MLHLSCCYRFVDKRANEFFSWLTKLVYFDISPTILLPLLHRTSRNSFRSFDKDIGKVMFIIQHIMLTLESWLIYRGINPQWALYYYWWCWCDHFFNLRHYSQKTLTLKCKVKKVCWPPPQSLMLVA